MKKIRSWFDMVLQNMLFKLEYYSPNQGWLNSVEKENSPRKKTIIFHFFKVGKIRRYIPGASCWSCSGIRSGPCSSLMPSPQTKLYMPSLHSLNSSSLSNGPLWHDKPHHKTREQQKYRGRTSPPTKSAVKPQGNYRKQSRGRVAAHHTSLNPITIGY